MSAIQPVREITRHYEIDNANDHVPVPYRGIDYPLSFSIDAGAVSSIVIHDGHGDELARVRHPHHAAIVLRSLLGAYQGGVRMLPATFMRELRTVRPDLVKE